MTTMSAPPQARAAGVPAEPRLLRQIHDTARADGLLAGLRMLAERMAPDGVPFGPAGHAVLPANRDAAGPARRLLTVAIGTDAVHAVRATVPDPVRATVPETAPAAWSLGVSWLRLGASRWLLRHATEHVDNRTVGGAPLVQQQMVKGMIADALTEQLEAEGLLDGRTDPAALIDANARIQAADRILLRLLGASGFQAGVPSHTCWVSELLADAYIGYETTEGTS